MVEVLKWVIMIEGMKRRYTKACRSHWKLDDVASGLFFVRQGEILYYY